MQKYIVEVIFLPITYTKCQYLLIPSLYYFFKKNTEIVNLNKQPIPLFQLQAIWENPCTIFIIKTNAQKALLSPCIQCDAKPHPSL